MDNKKREDLKLIAEWEYDHDIKNKKRFSSILNDKEKYIEEYVQYIIPEIEFYLNIQGIGLKMMIIKIFFKKEKIFIFLSFLIVFYINFFMDVNLISRWMWGVLIISGAVLGASIQSLYYRNIFENLFKSERMQKFVVSEWKNNHTDNKSIREINVLDLWSDYGSYSFNKNDKRSYWGIFIVLLIIIFMLIFIFFVLK